MGYASDSQAFVFNLESKFTPNDSESAINTQKNGFCFGGSILAVTGSPLLNGENQGRCCTGRDNFYDIEGEVSPLTN